MLLREAIQPIRMLRIALVAPADRLRLALVRVAAAGVVEFDDTDDLEAPGGEAAQRLHHVAEQDVTPTLAVEQPDLAELERAGRADLLAGEAQLTDHAAAAVHRGSVAAIAGWCPAPRLAALTDALSPDGIAVVPMPVPRGAEPPTLLAEESPLRRSFAPLVRTYGTVPYPDVDPTVGAGIAYVVMFGMMFGDAGHGVLLLVLAALLWARRPRRLWRVHRLWPFVAGAGLAATAFGALYGEFFGPTEVLPVLWLHPLDEPLPLLAVAIAFGAALLAIAYAVGTVNRWREGGIRLALYAPSGIAGTAVFLGLGLAAGGGVLGSGVTTLAGLVVAVAGVVLATFGMYAGSGGGATGAVQTGVGVVDLLLRLGSNLVSFARLAAFGMTHAALGWVIWQGTVGVADRGVLGALTAAVIFLAGNAVAFSLEALVAGVQALRLEFYELFSRVFVTEGRPFRPWHVPTATLEAAP